MENKHVYQAYDIRITDDNEVIAIVEPDSYLKELVEDKSECWELDMDVEFDEEEKELYLVINLYKKNGEIHILLPYGEAWDALIEKGTLTIALLTEYDLEFKDLSDAILLTVEINEFYQGFIVGAERTWEEITD